uniref:Uncharacterized protein n=1 Tax=Heterosigma akashiwo TaxID=2829 RepID=A0A7S3URJ5_HETAK
MYSYSFVGLIPIIWGVISHQEKQGYTITKDWGYVLVLGLMTIALPSVLGKGMGVLLPSTSTFADQCTMLFIWTVLSGALRSFWGPICRRAMTPFVGPAFFFPLQLSVDIYDELIFIVSDYRSAGFVILLSFRVAVNFIRNSGLWWDFVDLLTSKLRLGASRAAAIAAVDEENAGSNNVEHQDKLRQQMHYLEQNSVTEALASLTVLSAVLFDKWLGELGLGESSVNWKLTPAQVNNTLITYTIVGIAIFGTSVISNAVLVTKFNQRLYEAPVGDDLVAEQKHKQSFLSIVFNLLVARSPLSMVNKMRSTSFSLMLDEEKSSSHRKILVADHTSFVSGQPADVIIPDNGFLSSPDEGIGPQPILTNSKEKSCTSKKEEETNDLAGSPPSDWQPAYVKDVWDPFALYFAATVLYVVLNTLFQIVSIYQKMRKEEW